MNTTEKEAVEKIQHTPTPWDWSLGSIYPRFEAGEVIACTDGIPFAAMNGAQQKANAAFIVRACNSFEALDECRKMLALVLNAVQDRNVIGESILDMMRKTLKDVEGL